MKRTHEEILKTAIEFRQGVAYYLPDWPEEPPRYFTHYVCAGKTYETGQGAWEAYGKAREQSWANAVRFSDQNQKKLGALIWNYALANDELPTKDLRDGEVYFIFAEVEVRKTDTVEDGGGCFVAGVLELAYLKEVIIPPPVEKEPEEDQEELWWEAIQEFNYLSDLEKPSMQYLLKHFTITRNKGSN